MRAKASLGWALLLVLQGLCSAAAAQTLTVGRLLDSALSDHAEQTLAEAARRAGLTVRMVQLPLLRSIEMADQGEIDADLGRIADVATQYRGIVAVPTPIAHIDVARYTLRPELARLDPEHLRPLRFGIVRGIFILRKLSAGLQVTEGASYRGVFEMLATERFDVALLGHLEAEIELRRSSLPTPDRGPRYWASEPLYLMLNRKHADLLPRLDAALQQMQREGYMDRAYAALLRRHGIAPLAAAAGN